VSVPQKERILLDLEDDQDVAARATARTDAPLSAQRDVIVGRDPRRNLYLDRALRPLAAVAVAGAAGVDDALPRSSAARARPRADELAEDAALHAPHLARAPARRARLRPVGRGGAGS